MGRTLRVPNIRGVRRLGQSQILEFGGLMARYDVIPVASSWHAYADLEYAFVLICPPNMSGGPLFETGSFLDDQLQDVGLSRISKVFQHVTRCK